MIKLSEKIIDVKHTILVQITDIIVVSLSNKLFVAWGNFLAKGEISRKLNLVYDLHLIFYFFGTKKKKEN